MFSKRHRIGFDNKIRGNKSGFSMFNRAKLCPCQFHIHKLPGNSHESHKSCAKSFNECDHPEADQAVEDQFFNPLMALACDMDMGDF